MRGIPENALKKRLLIRIKTGSFLNDDDHKSILVGSTIAQNLNVSVEDKIIISVCNSRVSKPIEALREL